MVQIDPLQDAVENLRMVWRARIIGSSEFLQSNAPGLAEAIEAVIEIGGTSHVEPPILGLDERQPEEVPVAGLYEGALDALAPRKLHDVWKGQGDYDDPLLPADEHEHQLVLARLRDDAEAEWQGEKKD